ncbi:thiosulfate oxidation carrier protein SoxY [Paracoccus sp. (in: a-proteobacteria)]|uniref:thiosulfate oxidation carrier protein SoxY n=1 Tax=Paracoccus sp. TaxID=267 RepID=UPI0026DF4952|nr:thiosulfate oxidation carrier protein SoxY [Paracoccus sp. (in: a-proteobacteria)]MDO5648209.1 thiosulfate oxidation carrier protein SoxY [Paracoccus sp. (in: a-proteobacteria)]
MALPMIHNRRQVLALGAGLGAVMLTGAAGAQIISHAMPQPDSTESDRIADEFLNGATPVLAGLLLDVPMLADSPSSVPVRVHVTEDLGDISCQDLIILAERNPMPLAASFRFGPAAGAPDLAIRLRLIETMRLRALARLSDGRVIEARADTTVASGGCAI